jgi:hypothetical protein
MRLLGWLFLIVLLLVGAGYFRGWFSFTTTHAGSKNEITVGVDNEKIGDDTKAIATGLSELSAQAAEKVKSLGRAVGPDESELEGKLTAVDPTARDLTLTANSEAIALHVPAAVSITRDGKSVGFEQLLPATRVKCSFQHAGDVRKLARIQILP